VTTWKYPPDFPHGEGLAFQAEYAVTQPQGLPHEQVKKIMRDNLADLLGGEAWLRAMAHCRNSAVLSWRAASLAFQTSRAPSALNPSLLGRGAWANKRDSASSVAQDPALGRVGHVGQPLVIAGFALVSEDIWLAPRRLGNEV
jgi:hypothetical protein